MNTAHKSHNKKPNILERSASFFSNIMEKYLPDALVIAIFLTLFTMAIAMVFQGTGPIEVLDLWGNGFWDLLEFSMQITLVLLTGFILAKTPIVDGALDRLTGSINSPRFAIVIATLVGGLGSWVNWGFGLVVGAIVARKLAMNVAGLHFPLAIAAGYSGFIIYGTGISGTIPLTIATPGHFLEEEMGLIALSDTVFSPVVVITTLVVLIVLPLFNAMLHPKDPAKVIELDRSAFIDAKPARDPAPQQVKTVSTRLNNSWVTGVVIGILGMLFTIRYFYTGGSLELDAVNFMFLFLGILLFARPSRFLEAVADGVKVVSGIIVQYPFYAGIMAILAGSGLVVSLANAFGQFATAETLPFWSFLSAGLINLLAPSGGGQWAIQGPVMIEAAQAMGASEAAVAMSVAFGDQWTNMIQPFWIIPVLAIAGLRLRNVMGYLVLILVLLGVIFGTAALVWGFIA